MLLRKLQLFFQETLLGPLRVDVRKECEKLVYFEVWLRLQIIVFLTERNGFSRCMSPVVRLSNVQQMRQLLASATARNDADACDPYAAVR